MRLPRSAVRLSLLTAAILAVMGGGTALASSESDDVTILVDGEEYSPDEGDSITDVGRDAGGDCKPMPPVEIQMTGEATLVEVYLDHEDCHLKASSIERADEPAPEEGTAQSARDLTYYHWYMKTSATRRGFLYFEELTATRTHIQAWLPSMGYSGPIKNANSARYSCYAWGGSPNWWSVRSCYLMSQYTRGRSSVWIKAMGKYRWDPPPPLIGVNTTAWAKSEIKGYTLGTQRFKSTCRHTGGYTRPLNYVRCERKWGRV